jgi:glycosyltransferase involved in cell wall biosynthesis
VRVTLVLPSAENIPIGGYKVVYEYANQLTRRHGHSVRILHARDATKPRTLRGRIEDLAARWRAPLVAEFRPDTWFQLDPRIESHLVPSLAAVHAPDADAVVATSWHTAEYVARYPTSKGRRFYFVQDYEFFMTAPDRIRQRMVRTYRAGMRHIAISAAVARMIAESGGFPATIIPNGLDFGILGVAVPVDAAERRAIGFPWRPEPVKRTSDALAALEIVRSRVGPVEAWSFGDRVPHPRPKGITFHKRPTDARLAELYNRTAVFLVPSEYEGWGLPGSEAMACGAALVSTNNGGVLEYAVDGQSAILRPPRDPAKLAEAVIRLLESPAERFALARRGADSIRRFTWEASGDAFASCLVESARPAGG